MREAIHISPDQMSSGLRLIAKGVDMKEIQSYVVLRGSRLNSEDKKRVIVESGAEAGGVLELKKVQAAIRMLGSGFFQEMTGARRDKGLKTYDHTAFTVDEIGDEGELVIKCLRL